MTQFACHLQRPFPNPNPNFEAGLGNSAFTASASTVQFSGGTWGSGTITLTVSTLGNLGVFTIASPDRMGGIPGDTSSFANATSGKQQDSIDALRKATETSYFKGPDAVWVKLVIPTAPITVRR